MARPKKTRKPSLSEHLMEVARQRGMTAQPAAAVKSGKLLWALLEDDHRPVRTAAAFALTRLRDPALVQAFILSLMGAPSAKLTKGAVTLAEAGYVNAVPYYVAGFHHSRTDKKLGAALARGMGLLADPSFVPLLIDALERDFVPTEAAEALGRLGDPSAAPSLLKALDHKKDSVRAAAAYSLGCLGTLSDDDEKVLREKLERLAKDKSRKVKLCAAVARFERGDPAAHDAIHAALG